MSSMINEKWKEMVIVAALFGLILVVISDVLWVIRAPYLEHLAELMLDPTHYPNSDEIYAAIVWQLTVFQGVVKYYFVVLGFLTLIKLWFVVSNNNNSAK